MMNMNDRSIVGQEIKLIRRVEQVGCAVSYLVDLETSLEQLDGWEVIMKILPQRGGLWLVVSILSYQSKLGLSPITTAR